MSEFLKKILNTEELQRLAFEQYDDYWCDIYNQVLVYGLPSGGYQQFLFFDDNQEDKASFGIPVKTVEDLMNRYKSITGDNLRYYEGDLPINDQ